MKLLIISACLINFGDDRGGVHTAEGETPEVTKDTAVELTQANRALYVNKADDPTKEKRYTASPEMVKAAQDLAKAKAAAEKEKANPPA